MDGWLVGGVGVGVWGSMEKFVVLEGMFHIYIEKYV